MKKLFPIRAIPPCGHKPPGKDGTVRPGEMWSGYGIVSVMQCPAFAGGKANWKDNPFTGYNYNSSYIGKVEGDPGKRTGPARISQIRDPGRTALFGDGQYGSGANKFMRAPISDRTHDASAKSVRLAGTQGFRHGGKYVDIAVIRQNGDLRS